MVSTTTPIPVDDSRARALAVRLADELFELGAIRSLEWQCVFARGPRHVFVPRFYQRSPEGWQMVDGTDVEKRSDWLDQVYSNKVLVTALDGDLSGQPISSSTEPGLMASMLELLDVQDHHRVLEIGTGTGYNAALLCERLGAQNDQHHRY